MWVVLSTQAVIQLTEAIVEDLSIAAFVKLIKEVVDFGKSQLLVMVSDELGELLLVVLVLKVPKNLADVVLERQLLAFEELLHAEEDSPGLAIQP